MHNCLRFASLVAAKRAFNFMDLFSKIATHLYLVPLTPILIVAALSVAYWCVLGAQALRSALGTFLLQQSERVLKSATIRRWALGDTASPHPERPVLYATRH